MRIAVDLDDGMLSRAKDYTGIADDAELVRAALKALVEREAARRLARLGGTEPDLVQPRRRRPR